MRFLRPLLIGLATAITLIILLYASALFLGPGCTACKNGGGW